MLLAALAAASVILLSPASAANTQPPRAPTQLQLTDITASSLSLSWQAPNGNQSVSADYGLYLGGARVARTQETRHTFDGLDCGMTYALGVDSYDKAGNHSGVTTFAASTAACTELPADTAPPSPPSELSQTGATETSLSLAWKASADNVGVAGYGVYVSGASVGASTNASFTFGNLDCGTSYTFEVDSFDAAGNRSERALVTASTAPCLSSVPALTTTVETLTGSENPAGAESASLSFPALADARVQESAPTTNYGTSYLRADGGSDPDVESYLSFAVSRLDGPIRQATLRVYASSYTNDGPSAYATSSGWSESAIVWNSRRSRQGLPLADKGRIASGTWVEYDVTSAVTGAGTYSFVLVPSSSDGVNFDSRERARPPELVITTWTGADTQPPTQPTDLTQTTTTTTSIAVSWRASTDNVGVTGYGLYRNGALVAESTATRHTFTDLSCDTSYNLGVDAFDAAGNRSTTALLTARTAACSSQGRTRHVYAGQDLGAAINAASSGDTIVVHSGTYPRTMISKQFISPTSVQAAAGESVVVRGISLSRAAFVNIAGLAVNSGSTGVDAFEVKDAAHDLVIERNTISGSRIGVKFYGRPHTSGWPRRVAIRNNNISGSYIDAVAIDGGYDLTVAGNDIHDLQVNGNHNDGVQAWAVDGLVINRNKIYFSGQRSWDCTAGCPNQGVMLGHGGDLVNQRVKNVQIEANVIHHYPGIPINLAGTENVRIVNNTAYDSGHLGRWSALSIGTKGNPGLYNNTGLEIWNNVFNRASCCGGGAPPAYCDFNIIRDTSGYLCGARNLTLDPLLLDRLTYRLLPGSPAIDSGVNRPGTPAEDVDRESYGVPERGARRG
jgi:chitodextrinase